MTASNISAQLDSLYDSEQMQTFVELFQEEASSLSPKVRDLYLVQVIWAQMTLRKFDEALTAAREFHESGTRTPKFARDLGRGLLEIGACHWMLNERSRAVEAWKKLCEGIEAGNFEYARDAVGGLTYGLMLWFAAIMCGDRSLRAYSLEFARAKVGALPEKAAHEVWPVPAAHFVLEDITASELVEAAVTVPSFLPGPRTMSKQDEKARHNLSLALLLMGADELARGVSSQSEPAFSQAACLKNPISSIPWYLARFEHERRSDGGSEA